MFFFIDSEKSVLPSTSSAANPLGVPVEVENNILFPFAVCLLLSLLFFFLKFIFEKYFFNENEMDFIFSLASGMLMFLEPFGIVAKSVVFYYDFSDFCVCVFKYTFEQG